MKNLKIELMKKRTLPQLLVTLGLFTVEMLWLFIDFYHFAEEDRATGYMTILFAFSLISVIFCPIYVTVLASLLADIEHKGETFRWLFTFQKKSDFYHTKLAVGAFMCALHSVLFIFGTLAYAFVYKFTGPIPWGSLLLFMLSSFLINMAGLLLQFNLALCVKNQAFGAGFGIGCAFVGTFMALFAPRIANTLFFWTNYFTTSPVSMEYDSATRISSYYFNPIYIPGYLSVLIWIAIFYIWGRILIEKGKSLC